MVATPLIIYFGTSSIFITNKIDFYTIWFFHQVNMQAVYSDRFEPRHDSQLDPFVNDKLAYLGLPRNHSRIFDRPITR